MSTDQLRKLGFKTPHEIGQREYRAIYETCAEAVERLEYNERGTERALVNAILGEFEDWAKSLRAKLHKAKAK